jgi:catechol 2,3-dioxygenase-like lactoylglutathione lyase family enzyme
MEIDCIGLFVNNIETMVKFYRDSKGNLLEIDSFGAANGK